MYTKQVRWYIKPLSDGILSTICTKNYWNRTTIVEIIVGSWYLLGSAFLQSLVSIAGELLILLFQPAICRADNVFTVKIAPSHGGSGLPSNTWFLGPTRVQTANSISIGSAIFAWLKIVTERPTNIQTTTSSTPSVTIHRVK